MRPELILQPLFYYLMLAAGMGVCLYLFLATKRQLHAVSLASGRQMEQLSATVTSLEQQLAAMDSKLKEAQEGLSLMVAPKPTPSGLNLNRRSQALRMARRGDRADQIAAALQIPHTEVALLLKVHRVMAETIPLKAETPIVAPAANNMADVVGSARR